jgi:hypothetical protein
MTHRPRSLRHEYELYVEREIEDYKESVPRRVLLGIGDEAVAFLAAEPQLALTELVLCEEVASGEGHVLVAGASKEGPALYLAAKGCDVTALDTTADVLERVMNKAVEVGLTGRIRGLVSDLGSWTPDLPLSAVICATNAFEGLSHSDRARAIGVLQRATTDGGVHLVETGAADARVVELDELESRYRGWHTSIEGDGSLTTFLAWKAVA